MELAVVSGAPATIHTPDVSDQELYAALPKRIPLHGESRELGYASRDALMLFVLARKAAQARDPRHGETRMTHRELALRHALWARLEEEFPGTTGGLYIIADGLVIASYGGEDYDPILC